MVNYQQILIDLAIQHHTAGDLSKAESIYQQILQDDPNHPDALHLLGVICHQMGKNSNAVDLITKVLSIKANFAEAHNNLGAALQELGRRDEAVASYHKAIEIKPHYAEVHSNLANALRENGQLKEAVACCQKAIHIKPDYAKAYNNLGNVLEELGQLDEAVTSYQKALVIEPEFAEANYNLGNMLQEQGNLNEAVKRIDVALSYKPEKVGWRIRKALFLPVIPYSQEDIQTHRDTLSKTLTALMNENLTVPDLVVDVGMTNFYLAYHGQNNKSLMQNIAELYIGVCPKLTYKAKHCQSKLGKKKDVLRIGFLSSYFRDHTIGKLTRGIIQHLSRDLFEVIVFRPPGIKDDISEIIDRTADKVVSLHKNLEKDWEVIEDEELDILFYPDIGMDPYLYFLSFARLAPVQAVTWGHPDTTGIPNIDYFISSTLLENSDASSHYTEQLIRLSYLPTYYFRPEAPEKPFIRNDYGLPDEGRLYVCPQSLFKFHPEFDDILGELLRRDPDGRLVLIEDMIGGYWKRLLYERFNRAFPDVVDQVIFVPHMPKEKYLGLLILADAVLDIPTFSGGNSSFEAFAMGAPIITWPHDFMRGRVTSAFYKQMGLNELIATDAESYLALALRLAHDTDFKSRMQVDIKANVHKLYERHEVVREMESFFIAAYEASMNTSPLGEWVEDTIFTDKSE